MFQIFSIIRMKGSRLSCKGSKHGKPYSLDNLSLWSLASDSQLDVLSAMPIHCICLLVSLPFCIVWSITSLMLGKGVSTPLILVRVGSWHTTNASGWLPWSNPSETPANEGWNRDPWPSIISQWLSSLSGDNHSTAPEMKSETIASIAMPLSAIKIPVCPVALKDASTVSYTHLTLPTKRIV